MPLTPRPRGDLCPACSRFIGPADACPYCDTPSARHPLLRVFRLASVVLAVGGLAALHLGARYRPPAAIALGSITPMMHFAYVRVAGRVERVTRRDGRDDYISFTVNDGTGVVRVQLTGDAARELSEREGIPACGTRVEAVGSLAVAADRDPVLRLRRASDLVQWTASPSNATRTTSSPGGRDSGEPEPGAQRERARNAAHGDVRPPARELTRSTRPATSPGGRDP